MLSIIGCWILGAGLGFLINAVIVWVIVTLMQMIGITMIGTWTVAFSWPLVMLFTIVVVTIRNIFSVTITKK